MKKNIIYILLITFLIIFILFFNLPIFTAINIGITYNIIPLKNIIIFILLLLILVGIIIYTLYKKSKKSAIVYTICLLIILSIFANSFKLTENTKSDLILTKDILNIINNEKIDIYPTEIKYVKQNKLNWSPRPFPFINIKTLETDNQNAEYYANNNAPKYILLNKNSKHNIFEQPDTFYQIINNYQITNDFENIALLKKSQTPIYPFRKIYPSDNINFNEWIKVPIEFNKIYLLQLNPIKTHVGSILNFLPQQTDLYIEYKLQNDEIKTYKLPKVEFLRKGILINPYLEDISMLNKNIFAKEIKIHAKNQNAYEYTIPAQWTVIKKAKN